MELFLLVEIIESVAYFFGNLHTISFQIKKKKITFSILLGIANFIFFFYLKQKQIKRKLLKVKGTGFS